MKNFLIYTLATITGIILSSLIFFVVMLASLSAIIASGEKTVSISDNSVLVLKAGVPVPDRGNPNPWAAFDIINMSFSPTPGLNDILGNIKKAAEDENIKGILIENGALPSGWATSGEIRSALIKFRESGKFVYAWSDYVMTQQGYYLSSSADKIYVNPGSVMEFKGLSGEVMFYKKALDKIGIEVQVVRHGKFKGAVEPYLLTGLSEENRSQIKDYVSSIWNHIVGEISVSRNITENELNSLADDLSCTDPAGALENGLVDGLIYRDALVDSMKTRMGVSLDDKIELVSMIRYSKVPGSVSNYSSRNKIAVIYAEGNIVMGKGNETNIGGNYYADIIREQRKDTTVKAIVLRVNSPGGNAIASDVMWRELSLTTEQKPVIVSMGNYAASGGYYISAPATEIYADPATLSGSIGVFGLIPNAANLLRDKIGITIENVNTNRYSDFPSLYRPMDIYEREVMQKSIEKVYTDFVNKVAGGRNLNTSYVDSIGQGRVWTGSRALEKGLVDELGGLEDAIDRAIEMAGVDKYAIREYPVFEEPYAKLLASISGDIRMRIAAKELGEYFIFYTQIKEISTLSGIQARLPYFIEIH